MPLVHGSEVKSKVRIVRAAATSAACGRRQKLTKRCSVNNPPNFSYSDIGRGLSTVKTGGTGNNDFSDFAVEKMQPPGLSREFPRSDVLQNPPLG
jgi:hypothetical protein